MATVYLAEHPRISKKVAVKVINHDLASSPEMVSRFLAEARAASQINHEHVVDILDFGQTATGENFMIMEYLEGQTLSARVRSAGRLDLLAARSIGQQIVEALVPAHQQGVIHRDLKPDNIFLIRRPNNGDFVKILDFGLAKLLSGSEGLGHRTSSGSVLGTPHYMAPEQCEGRVSVDGRADLYSLGCILFHMVTGGLPFPGDGFAEVILKHIAEPPPSVRTVNPQISPAFDKLILHCLAKSRDHRFQSAEELLAALLDPEKWSVAFGDDPAQILGPPTGARRPPQGPTPSAEPPQMPTVMGQQVPAALAAAGPAGRPPGDLLPIASSSMVATPRPTPIGRAGTSASPGFAGGSQLQPPPLLLPKGAAAMSQLAEAPVVARAAPQMATMIGELPAAAMSALAALAPPPVNAGVASGAAFRPVGAGSGDAQVPAGQLTAGASIPTAFPAAAAGGAAAWNPPSAQPPPPAGYAPPGYPPSYSAPGSYPSYPPSGSQPPQSLGGSSYPPSQSYPSPALPQSSQLSAASQANLAPSAATPASAASSAGQVSPVAPIIGKLVRLRISQAFLSLPPARRLVLLRLCAAGFASLVVLLLTLLLWPRNQPLIVRSDPDQAEVLLDGESLGTTPVLIEQKRGSVVKLTVRKRGFTDSAQEFTVGGDKVVLVTLATASSSPKPSRGKRPVAKPADDAADDGGDAAGGDSGKGDGGDDTKKKPKKKKKKKVVLF